jgi:THO complex subunit 2
MELGVLKTLIKDAGGYGFADYSPAASLSTTQLEGRAGSMLLKRETMSFGVVETVNSRTVEQIRSVLLSDNIGVSLLILLSQLKSRILFEPSSSPMRPKPVKLIGNLFDSCQVVVSILLEFLTSSIGDEPTSDNGKLPGFITQFAASMPSFRDLIEIFRLDVASGWLLCRPLVRLANAKKMTDGEGEEPMKDFALSESMRIAYKAVLPEATWQNISCELYEIFFSSSLYDLFCPEECYKAESDRVSKEVDRLIQRRKGAPQSSLLADTRFSKADEDELDRTKKAITILGSDLEKQKVHVAEVKRLIESKKSELFPTQKVSPTTVNTFLTHCIYPRCMQSPEDAVYCARFVSFLHSIETPGFSTLHFLDELILVLAGALYGLTEAEAANVAILLTETWRVISTWRYDKDVFEKEVAGKVGAFMVKEEMTSDDDVSQIEISFQEFESLYNKWHAAVGAAAMGCLKSAEYMHTRAGLVVLTRMVDVFPTKPRLAQSLVAALAPFQAENYPLQDIKTSAQAYGTLLVKARDEGAWKEEDAAVTKARVEKEQAAAALRKKQAEERFAEMNRESRQIMDTLGGDGRSRSRDERRRAPSRGDLGDLHKVRYSKFMLNIATQANLMLKSNMLCLTPVNLGSII